MKKSFFSTAIIAAAGVLALGLASTAANAATATSNMAVTAQVVATCVINANPLAFGNYTGAVNNAATTLSVTCTNTTPYTIGLNPGIATGATVSNRSMQNGAILLGYKITQDSAHATNWGNTPGTDTPASANGTGSAQTINVYGQIPAGQYVTPGSYSDTVTATLNY